MYSYSIDEALGSLGYEIISESTVVVNFNDFIFNSGLLTVKNPGDQIFIDRLFVEYAVFGEFGESLAHQLIEDLQSHSVEVSENLRHEDADLSIALEGVIASIRVAMDTASILNNIDKNLYPVLTKWIDVKGAHSVAEISLFHNTDR